MRRALVAGSIAVVAVAALVVAGFVVVPKVLDALPRPDDVTAGPKGSAVPAPLGTGPAPGAPTVGSVSYPIPDGSLFVAPGGSNSAAGSRTAPLLSVQHAVNISTPGQTIVLRAGTYHERVTVPAGKRVTIQPYPNEAVWFDGSVVVSDWQKSGSVWVSNGWTTQFDSSPTFTKGAPESTLPAFNFVDPKYPLAAHPDQVWVDGKPLTQVATASAVKAGTFAVDYAAQRLYIGSDPKGHEVRASDKTKAIAVQGEGTTLKGFGVRRFATSVPGFGAITAEAPGITLQDLDIEQNATTGLFVGAANIVVRNVTTTDNGMLGVNGNYADNLLVSGLLSDHNNLQRFNTAPVSGGMKITRSRVLTIRDSSFSHNLGVGLWFDQSVYDGDVIDNTMDGNVSHGMSMEISSTFVVAGNTIVNNDGNGIKLNDTDHVRIWFNTVANNTIDLRIAQDVRRGTDTTVPGHDPRRPNPDPQMSWVIKDVVASNNVFSGATLTGVVTVQDYSGQYTAEQLGVTLNGNAYQRPKKTQPRSLVLWERGGDNAKRYSTFGPFVSETGQEKAGVMLPDAPAASRTWLTSPLTAASSSDSRPALPGDILALLGWDSPDHRVGAD